MVQLTIAVELKEFGKTFSSGRVLDGVSFSILPGEVHGLVGQNGSGKSTLIKILAGYHAPDPGSELFVDGTRVALPFGPGGFHQLGFAFVHQHLALVPSLTVLENLFVGNFSASRLGYISWKKRRLHALQLFEEFGLSLDPSAVVRDLSPTERALLAVVRATDDLRMERPSGGRYRGLLVLDEVTVFLPKAEIDQVFSLMKAIASDGASILFVSHHLNQVRAVADRVSVLRDGRLNGPFRMDSISDRDIVKLIVGRDVPTQRACKYRESGAAHVVVEGLHSGLVQNLSFEVSKGEVLGLTGLVGSGFSDILYGMFGARPCSGGQLRIGSKEFDMTSLTPKTAVKYGMALVPGDRARDGAVGSISVGDNVTLMLLPSFFRRLMLRRRSMSARALHELETYSVRPPVPGLAFNALSGGNQQKVLFAKWLAGAPEVLLLDEPTQGVDVGARSQVWELIRDTAASGRTVICASTDYEQLEALCDRVLVISGGRIVAELNGDAVSKEAIAHRCYGTLSEDHPAVEVTA